MNSVQLIGRLTRDPDADHTARGTAVTAFRLAIDRTDTGRRARFRDRQDLGAAGTGHHMLNPARRQHRPLLVVAG